MITAGEMLGWTNRFREIVGSKANNHLKDMRLASLMDDMEGAYDIPMLQKAEFENADPFVMQMYRTVSEESSI